MLIVRADGNAKIGAGHLMRCLTVAEAAREQDAKQNIFVLCADEASAQLAMSRGFQAGVLHTDYRSMEEELPKWNSWIKGDDNVILVDSYYVTDAYLAKLRRWGRVFLMDDMQEHAYPVDAVVNYNLFADREVYRALYWEGNVKCLLGSRYTPLRPQFRHRDYAVRESVQRVLLTTGGGDADNIAGAVLDGIYREDMEFHVLVGRFSPHFDWWQKRAQGCANVIVHADVKDMAGLMEQCDLAITAGGSTVYELCAVGTPFVAFAYATNQELLVQYLKDHNIAKSAGMWHRDREAAMGGIQEAFADLLSCERRRFYSEREHGVVDGLGAVRLASELCVPKQ